MYLRDLRGDDEESITGTDTWSAIAFVDRLLVKVPGAAVGPGSAAELGAADRDRILAVISQRELGERVLATVVCTACTNPFDLDFSLGALVREVDSTGQPAGPSGVAVGNARIRVPSGTDELEASVSDDPSHALATRCTLAGTPSTAEIGEALERCAPLLDLELDATCPACAAVIDVRFSVQHYVLGAVMAEERKRSGEIHQIAREYGWSLGEILSLPRRRRHAFVGLLDRGAPA